MNSKTRGILLSVFAVLFSAASVFAITADDLASVLTTDSDTIYTDIYTEGYNYKQRFYVDTSSLEETIGTVSWEVYPAYDWLKWHIGSDDKNIIFEGVLPAYDTASADANTYTIHAVAHISGDVVSYDSEGNEITYSGDISADVEYNSGLEITVDQVDTSSYWFSQFTDFVSYDTSALSEARKDDYSVTLTFKTSIDLVPDYLYVSDDSGNWEISTDEEGEYVLKSSSLVEGSTHVILPLTYDSSDLETFAGVFNLPAWLGYKVVSTQVENIFDVDYNTWTSGDTVYVKELEIFYSEDRRVYPEDSEPEDDTKGTVLIGVDESSLAFNDEYRSYIDPDYENASYDSTPIIKWDVSYSRIPPITLESSEVTLPVSYDSSADMTVKFYAQIPSGDITFTPDISEYVKLSADWKAADSTEYSGDITIYATPVAKANAVYSTDMIVTDTNGLSASLRLNVSIDVPVIKLSYDYNGETYPHMSTAPFAMDNPDIHTEWWYATPISIDLSMIPAGLNVTAISLDGTSGGNVKHGGIWFFYAPVVAGSWDGTIKVYDEYGGSADLMMSLRTEVTSEDMTTSVTVSGDTSETPSIYSGQSATLIISAKNSYGPVTWTLDNATELYALGITLTQTASTDSTAVYTLTTPAGLAAGTYEAHISAEDGIGRKAVAYTFTINVKDWPITLSGDFASIDVVYPASGEATVQYYYAEFTSWSMSQDISADISFDITSIPAESADSTTVEGVISVVATPITASTDKYTTTLYFTDKNGNTDSRDITVNVTLPDFKVTASADSLSLIKGNSADVTFTASGNVGLVTWTLGEIPGGITVESADTLNATQYDTVRSYVVTANAAGNYSFDVTAKDTAGRTTSATVNVEVKLPDMTIDAKVSGDTTIYAGENATVTLTADNAYGKVTWGVSNMTDLTALGITFSKVSETDTSAVYTIGTPLTLPAGTYTANITATDSLDRTAAVYNLTITAKAAPITLSGDLASIDVVYPASGEATVQYYYSPFVSWSMSPDISADVSLDVTSTPANSTTVQGVISVAATPLTASADTYTTTLTFTDGNGNTDSREITINVTLPDLTVKASAASLSLIEGNSEDVTFTASGNAGLVTWTLGEIPDGITVTSSDIANATAYGSIMSYVVTANAAGSYSFDVTAKDAAGRNASATVNVTVTASGDFAVTTESSSLNVDVNAPKNISFSAVNNSGVVTWKLGDVPEGIRVEPATDISYATANGTLMIYTVTGLVPGASGTITVTATDEAGNTASSTVTITVAGVPGTFAVSPSAPSVTVNAGSSQNVSLTAANNSGLVTWKLGNVSSGVTVAAAEDTSYATREMTTMIYTVTGVTAGTYSVPVTATDAAGHTSTATISVTVTAATLTITPAETSVTVNAGSSQKVEFTASGNSGYVAWTVSTSSTAFTISPAPSAYATQDNTRTAFAITGITAGASGTVTVTATDAAGHTASATINVTVNSGSGGDTGKIDTPTVDITDDTVQSTIKQSLFAKLGSKITSGTEIATLPSTATSGTVSYVGTNTVYIPTIVVEVAKIYVFGVSLENLTAGSLMTWTPHVSSSSTGEYLTASAEEENATFLDDSGNEVTRVPANKHVNVAAYFEPGKTYEPTITTTSSPLEIVGVGSSSGGCSAGLGALVSALAAAFFISKKRS